MDHRRDRWLLACAVVCLGMVIATPSRAQELRYEPSTPTISPYLNLFRDRTSAVPNYYSLVRPQLLQIEQDKAQRRINQQNAASANRLQSELTDLQRRQATLLQLPPTGKNAWFLRPSERQQFMNTGTFYSRAGTRQSR